MTIGTVDAWIANGAYGNTNVASSYGLPGSGLTAAYVRCDFGIRITVEDDLSTYCSINGGEVKQTNIIGNSFPSYLWCEDHAWEGTITEANKWDWINDPQRFLSFDMTKGDGGSAPISHGFPAASGRGAYIGKLNNFVWESETSGTGYVWIGGLAIYTDSAITNPIFIRGERIAVPGLRALLDYYPWSLKKGSTWRSCNRSGGSLKIRKGSTWRDCKNTESTDQTKSKCFTRHNSAWVRSPKTGTE